MPITGISTFLTSLIIDQSDSTAYLWSLVGGWTTIAEALAFSMIFKTLTVWIDFLSYPLMILTVDGTSTSLITVFYNLFYFIFMFK